MASRLAVTFRDCFVVVLVVLLAVASLFIYRMIFRPIPIQTNAAIIHIDKSTTARSLLRMMHDRGWIGSVSVWSRLLQIQGLSSKLKAGTYQILPNESVLHLLRRIVAGDVLRERFLIRPGTTLAQVRQDMSAAPYLEYTETDWSDLESQHSVLEGLLLADTYVYEAGTSARTLIVQAHDHLQSVLEHAWQDRLAALPYLKSYDALIVASILEKEAAVPAERRLISGVIVNRLRQHIPLQMDPTVIYALGPSYQGSLHHAQMDIDSPYNTYRHRGLPPTPIAMVTADSIDAACHPEMSDYLYFVAKGDGTHVFTSNYQAHRAAIKKYMRKAT
ncbi:MAG: endolytic transglycosylase MltG [Gammaproteobacteria bacterium]|nr:endolytic transglycosylase MltG [Gammaproteobacteria bacterium]